MRFAQIGAAMLTPEGLRAARGLLNWGVRDLAAASGIAFTTVNAFENGRPMRASTAAKIVHVLASQGVELVTDDARTGAVLIYARRRDLGPNVF
jgi:transcriptional regulator with XRE-family HTH domain